MRVKKHKSYRIKANYAEDIALELQEVSSEVIKCKQEFEEKRKTLNVALSKKEELEGKLLGLLEAQNKEYVIVNRVKYFIKDGHIEKELVLE